MTTRASTARGQDKQQFQGRVRKWRRQWDIAGDTAKYKLLRWVSTGLTQMSACIDAVLTSPLRLLPYSQLHAEERTEDRTGPRFPGLLPVRSTTQGLTHSANTLTNKSRLCAGCQACQAAPKVGSSASEST